MPISVVIPCHNSLRFLPETLASVLDQDLPEELASTYEVVLVDDGGSDNLDAWVAELGDDRVRVVRQDNAGVSAARNLGIRSVKGDFVAFCDSDDLWTPDTARELHDAFGVDPLVGLSYGGYDIIDGDGQPTGHESVCDWEGQVWDRLIMGNKISASVVMVRRAVFDEVGYFAENRHRFPVDVEDWELWLRIADKWRVAAAPKILMHCRRHDSNSSLNVESLEAAYENLLEVSFAGADPARAQLRPLAKANIEIRLASVWLNDRHDAKRALEHLAAATDAASEIRRDGEYAQILVGAWVLRLTGERGFAGLRGANAALRRFRQRL